jgi:hypothetical protein
MFASECSVVRSLIRVIGGYRPNSYQNQIRFAALHVSSFHGQQSLYSSSSRLYAKEDDGEVFRIEGGLDSNLITDRDTFLFGDTQVPFRNCGLESVIYEVLEASGMHIATAIQTKAIGAIASGSDVIIGAETGSGKTLSYLIPVIQRIITDKKLKLQANKEIEDNNISSREIKSSEVEVEEESTESTGKSEWERRVYPTAVIMAPNKELCNQVQRMAEKVLNQLRDKGVDISIGNICLFLSNIQGELLFIAR